MAHEVQVFCQLDRSPAAALDELVAALASYQPVVDQRREGVGWISADLSRPGGPGVVVLEIHGVDEATKFATEFAAAMPDAPDLSAVTGMVVLTLTGPGEVDAELLGTLLRTLRTRWHGIPYDEMSGFAVRLD